MRLSERTGRRQGHYRKILAVIDGTKECERAVIYAAAHAKSTQSKLALLYVIDNSDFCQIFGVEHIMRAEATEHAEKALTDAAVKAKKKYKIKPEKIIREGLVIEQITALIEEDSDMALLVLAAGGSHEGPGPLIQALVGQQKAFALPVTVIPDGLTDAMIDEIA